MKATTIAVLAAALFAVAYCDKKPYNNANQAEADRSKRHGYGGIGGGAVLHGGHQGGLGYGGGVSSLGAGSHEQIGSLGGGYGGALRGHGGRGGHGGHGTLYRGYVEAPKYQYSRGYAKSTSSGIVSGHPSPAKYTYGGSSVGQQHYQPQYYYRPSHSVYQQSAGYGGGSSLGGLGHGRGYGGRGAISSVSYGQNSLGHGGHLGGYGGGIAAGGIHGGAVRGGYGGGVSGGGIHGGAIGGGYGGGLSAGGIHGGAIGGGYGGGIAAGGIHGGAIGGGYDQVDDSIEGGYGSSHGHGHGGLVGGGSHAVGGGYGVVGGGYGGSSIGHQGSGSY